MYYRGGGGGWHKASVLGLVGGGDNLKVLGGERAQIFGGGGSPP